MVIIIVL